MNAITVQGLGKKFKLFPSQGARFLEYLSMGSVPRHTDFWALQDISFEIPAGTTLGIVGQNGSGKSTLLSILAGILEPSAGGFTINGKVSAILELGSGFHPEFSGRDNVYMYGSIVGLSEEEIDARFDEIVRFSELADFIDQPLRTYSSGMVVRLAFSVAVNVNADILIVDEALAVGDAVFQHRCFRKIREMQQAGKTILYVGHDTEAVRNLCTRALLLDHGRIREQGDPNTVVNRYYALVGEREEQYGKQHRDEEGTRPPAGYETVYNFMENLSRAAIVHPPGAPVLEQTVEVRSAPRKVLFAHPPSGITYTLRIEPYSSLAFAIGILPAAWDSIPQGVKFSIEILCEGQTTTVFSRILQPKGTVEDRGWHNVIVPLEPFSGKTVSITFSTAGTGDDLRYGWSAWGWVRLVRGQPLPPGDGAPGLRTPVPGGGSPPAEPSAGLRYGNRRAVIEKVELLNAEGSPQVSFRTGEEMIIRYTMTAHEDFVDGLTIGFIIRNKFTEVYGTNTRWRDCDLAGIRKGPMPVVTVSLGLFLGTGTYSLTSAIAIVHPEFLVEVLDRMEDHIIFHVRNDRPMSGFTDLRAVFRTETMKST